MKLIKPIIGLILLVFTVFLSLKTVEKFAQANCTAITDCKTCANTMGCTYCSVSKKCVNTEDKVKECPNDSRFPVDTFYNSADDCIDCGNIKDCGTCAELDPCSWCKSSNKCVPSSQTSTLCPRESYAIDKDACDITRTDISGIPLTFDIDSSVSELRNQLDSGVYSSGLFPTDTSSGSSTSSTSGTYTTFDYSDAAAEYPGTSIIPILGLSRDNNEHLTRESLKTVIQAAKNLGFMINTDGEKKKLLDAVDKETNFYINQKKDYMKKFLANSIDYINDSESLKKLKNLDMRIMDLSDISGFIKGINIKTSDFIEGYQNINQKDIFEYTLEKNRYATNYLGYLWMLNLVGVGTFVYFISK